MIHRMTLSCVIAFWMVTCSQLLAEEAKWQNLLPTITPSAGVVGEWSKPDGILHVDAIQGGRLMLPIAPSGEYDYRVSFTRHTGRDSIALIFIHGGKQAAFEVDAWGQHLSGVQSIDGKDIRQNATRKTGQQLENNRKYTMTVEVRSHHVRCLLDDDELANVRTTGDDLSLMNLWRLPKQDRLGIGAWNSETTIHSIEVRSTSNKPLQIASASSKPGSSRPNRPAPSTTPMPANTPMPNRPANRARNSTSKHVLIIIANQDFFYREYADPRAELERAGFRVSVAAGTKSPCRPHNNSGQGNNPGVVQPDLALANVKVKDYDAVLFSGGWGASSYQFAFTGRYNNGGYNGNRAIKTEANRIVNEFIAADKYTCALCNAVSVLAWARVDGKSPLAGKRVCAPTRDAPSGIYNGQRAQPSCRWHPEANGAIMSPAGSIGQRGTAIDDVIVDGKIITGEDDISAREMGRRIVQVLSRES